MGNVIWVEWNITKSEDIAPKVEEGEGSEEVEKSPGAQVDGVRPRHDDQQVSWRLIGWRPTVGLRGDVNSARASTWRAVKEVRVHGREGTKRGLESHGACSMPWRLVGEVAASDDGVGRALACSKCHRRKRQ